MKIKNDYNLNDDHNLDIAVIGMNARLPGSENTKQYWENLKNSVESIHFFSDKELGQSGVNLELIKKSNYVKAGGILDNIEYFDAQFFGYTVKEATIMDPQFRLFHEAIWQSLEIAGYDPRRNENSIGIYVGARFNLNWANQCTKLINNYSERFEYSKLWDKDYLATRIAYNMNLTGPALTLDTACSTLLVAAHLACRALQSYDCDMALAASVFIFVASNKGYLYEPGSIHSSDGHCRPFDIKSNGTVWSDGLGVVVLKRFNDAIKDGDNILAVIKGSAINNDGSQKTGYMTPSVNSQAKVIKSAQQIAQVSPETITYVEAHGTGTEMGDPIEVEALKQAFNTDKKGYCGIGSVKGNIGHTAIAAGAASLIKTILALQHKLIPPSINYEKPNPKIDFKNSPFYVVTKPTPWKRISPEIPLRAGVSSFGIGGTNAHVILEEAPELPPTDKGNNYQLIILSAKTPTALEVMTTNLANHLADNPGINLADVAFTLQVGRGEFKHRRILVCPNNIKQATEALLDTEQLLTYAPTDFSKAIAFMFSGQSSQYINMGLGLYQTELVFKQELDYCLNLAKDITKIDFMSILYPQTSQEIKQAQAKINQIEYSQPILFIFEYALTKLLISKGVNPHYLIGHSLGEYTAACISGVLSLEDAIKLVSQRAKLIASLQPGVMLAISIIEDKLVSLLNKFNQKNKTTIDIAANNSSVLQTVSGTAETIAKLESELTKQKYQYRRLNSSQAMHSSQLEPILTQFKQLFKQIKLNQPTIPYISNLTGELITDKEAQSPDYWVKQLRNTVQFNQGIKTLLKKEDNLILIEVGPGNDLATFVKQQLDRQPTQTAINLIKKQTDQTNDYQYLLTQLGQLWLRGIKLDWPSLYQNQSRRRLPLPTYPFERKRYWPALSLSTGQADSAEGPEIMDKSPEVEIKQLAAPEQSKLLKKPDVADWFYIPTWERSDLDSLDKTSNRVNQNLYLVFTNENDFNNNLIDQLKQTNQPIITVKSGKQFSKLNNNSYTIDLTSQANYVQLFKHLTRDHKDLTKLKIVHAWQTNENNERKNNVLTLDKLNQAQDRGLYSLIYLAQALEHFTQIKDIEIDVITTNLQSVTKGDIIQPEKSTILGPIKVIPQEYPNIKCRSIDIQESSKFKVQSSKSMINNIIQEITTPISDQLIVAYRDNQRYIQSYQSIKLDPASKLDGASKPKQEISDKLRQHGTYLITGGLGAIGLTIAQYLAKTVQANLILIGRTKLPDRKNWNKYLKENNDSVSQKIKKIQELEQLGATVFTPSADVANLKEMTQIVRQAEQQFGQINGVVHAAGVIDYGGIIQKRTSEELKKTMSVKTEGVIILNQLLGNRKNKKLDFFLLCSSVSAIKAPAGEVGYTAANNFLDYFACYKTTQDKNTNTVSINWPAWSEVGMAVESVRKKTSANKVTIDLSNLKPRPIKHYLFDQYVNDTKNNREIYIAHFSSEKNWFLSDHKVLGRPTVAGVNYLEMARSAVAKYAKNKDIQIQDVYFPVPLDVAPNQVAEVIFSIKKDKNEQSKDRKINQTYQFSIVSKIDQDNCQEHAQGKIVLLDKTPIKQYDIKQLEKICDKEVRILNQSNNKGLVVNGGIFEYGPRWQVRNWIKYGGGQALGSLELSARFVKDFNNYQLHPALIDQAVGILIKKLGQPNSSYLPLSYKSLTIKRSLTSKIYSYVKPGQSSQISANKDNLSFDISLLDESGRELVIIKEFTERRVIREKLKFTSDIKKSVLPADNFVLQTSNQGDLNNLKFVLGPRQKPGPDEAEIEVEAAALNFKDVLLAMGMILPMDKTGSISLGLECSGKVIRIGENVKNLKVGDKVMATAMNCFSAFVTTPTSLIYKKPDNLSLIEAASVPIVFVTAYHMLVKSGKLKRGEKILIHSAAGGVGLAAVQIAQWKGAEIFATAGSDEKGSFLRYLGIKHVFNSRTLDFADEIKKITKDQGVDMVLNSLADEFRDKSIEILATHGRFLEIGIRGIKTKLELETLYNKKKITFFNLLPSSINAPTMDATKLEILKYFQDNIFKPLPYKAFPAADIISAFEYMSQAKHMGKIVISFNDRDKVFNDLKNPNNETTAKLLWSISPKEALVALERVLVNSSSQIIISPIDFINQPKRIDVIDQSVASSRQLTFNALHSRPNLATPYLPPKTELEEKLAVIWQEVLGLKEIGINDNFFEIGGSSLNIIQIVNKIEKVFGKKLVINELFDNPTISKIEKELDKVEGKQIESIKSTKLKKYYI